MPVSGATLQLLMDAGLDGADLLRVVQSIEADNPVKKRSANATRQARHRAKQRSEGITDNVISNVTSDVTSVTPLAGGEDNLQTKNQTGPKKRTQKEELADFKAELSSMLDAERIDALVEVRKTKSGKLNGHAARLLIAKIRDSGLTPQQAADEMALRNWISIERSWVQRNAPHPHAASPPPKVTRGNMWNDDAIAMGIIDDPTNSQPQRLATSQPGRQDQGPGLARRFAVVSGG